MATKNSAALTRRDFQAVAAVLASTKPNERASIGVYMQWREDVEAIAGLLARSNPRFDLDRFLLACHVPSEEVAALLNR